jgi:indole-3-glycerol phosphate synthase
MNILETIIKYKQGEVARNKELVSLAELERQDNYGRKTISLREILMDGSTTGIIAEFKRKSPSKGIINSAAVVADVTRGYAENGAACLSVLTDAEFFGGSSDDLQKARINNIPILHKDFIIDKYQLAEAKVMGADVILLIAACLTPGRVKELAFFAKSLKLEVLLEIHTEYELEHVCNDVDFVGVNNRDLRTFTVDINRSIELSRQIPADKIKIAESGINQVETIQVFKEAGFKGFLMGENFMKAENPVLAFKEFVQKLKQV